MAVAIAAAVVTVGAMALRSYIASYNRSEAKLREIRGQVLSKYLIFKQLSNIKNKVFGKNVGVYFDGKVLRFLSSVPLFRNGIPGIYGVALKAEEGTFFESCEPIIDEEDLKDWLSRRSDELNWYRVFSCGEGEAYLRLFYKGRWMGRWNSGGEPQFLAFICGGEARFVVPFSFYGFVPKVEGF